ncbi:MBL fold metallo-hydrolase [Silicimonas algicola]|uniref:Glyoxylase-like metal-dependent hydrolase (Beta-lactamase superfamily II) n=1 Tax=Silicimonas algicola TaxID=1826607 RepID=A0A316GIP5_9RHOB|nr:MBL fold metallo-hydrolase [Silicimonas algicola]AZQ68205.1 MBL fold metallo-hydrolase [Silicimonas algicola]PWK54667.1 glyoxylase-like metal-dependent hydrolase (beta-lactamase superfamily II) [Silicimonas algicola]
MTLSRRSVLRRGAALGASLLVPRFAVAETSAAGGSLITVSDGYLSLPRSYVLGSLTEAEAGPILDEAGITGEMVASPCNVTLFRDKTRTVLFDCGSGSEFMPTAGDLLEGLEAAGVAPEDVTHILFTHAHPDHLWGYLDDFGDPAFPEAALMIGQAEWDYWMDPATIETIDEARQAFVVGAQRRLEIAEEKMTFFNDGDEVLAGIAALATYGHTPGHMSFQVGTDDPVFVIGDAISNGHVSFRDPSWELGSDQDPATAAATRSALMERLVGSETRMVGYHLPDGGLGRVARAETGYRFIVE